nr:Gldg family protein [Pseudomonas sp. AU8050]
MLLEYHISLALQTLAQTERPVIGQMSSLPLAGCFDVQSGRTRQPWRIMQAIGNAFDVHEVAPDVDTIDSKLKVLMLVHPKRLPRATLRGIYQFVLRGGRRSIRAICDAGARRRTDRATDRTGVAGCFDERAGRDHCRRSLVRTVGIILLVRWLYLIGNIRLLR